MLRFLCINRRISCSALVVMFLAALPVRAQIGGTGTIQGVVTDPSGSAIPGASVTVENAATQVKTSRQTTEAGYFVVSPLAPGEYTVSVSASGFQTTVRERVRVDALGTVALDFKLQIGAAAESVTVTDTPPPINTSDARVGQTVRNELYTALPLAMSNAPRDPTAFVQYMPGVVPGGSNAAGQVFGAQANTQEVYVEGLPITNSVVQGEVRNLGLGISVEAVDQFQLETAGAAVMFNGQGATNFVLKSGSNQFHGTAFEFFRNTLLDARSYFALRRPPEHQNQYGVTISGPVVKNRVFFFGSYDAYRYRTGSAATLVSIPTTAQRLGDFSQLPVQIFDPLNTATVGGVRTRMPFALNRIPDERISPASKTLQAALPVPTYPTLQSNYLSSLPTGVNNDSTTDKVDVTLNDRNSLFFLFSRGKRGQSTPYRGTGNGLPLPYADTRLVEEIPTTMQVRYTIVVNPNLINQMSLGFSRLWVPILNATIDGDWMTKAGVKGLPPGEAASSFPEIAWGGPNAPAGWRGTNSRAFIEALNTYTWQDNVQYTRGKHSVTLGAQLQWLQANERTNAYGSLATWNFSNTQTAGFDARGTLVATQGNAYASYLLGAVNSAIVTQDSVVGTGGRYRSYAWWVQDNFRVNQKLTLNLGLRHDIMLPYVEVLDRESYFDPAKPNPAAGGYNGILAFYGSGQNGCGCRTTVNTHYRLFGPRLGFAYAVAPKTVIRGGYSVMYTRRGAVGGRGGARTGTGTLGLSASPSFTSLDQGISPAFYWDAGVPAYDKPPFLDPTLGTAFNGSGKTGSTMQYGDALIGGKPPYYQNWNIGFERALTGTLTLGVNYVGSNGHFQGGGGRGMWSGQMDPRYLPLGNLLQSQATVANIAAANAIIPGIGLPFPTFTGTISQMLRPFPQYPGINDLWGDVANASYNSLQVILNKRLSHGLVLNSNYVFSKAFSDDSGSRSAYNWRTEKAQQVDPSHTVNVLLVYSLPFGKGQKFTSSNRFAQALVSDWRLSSISTYRSGILFASILASCNLPNAGSCYADYNPAFSGDVRIHGNYGSGDVRTTSYVNKSAFASPAAFNYGTTPRTGAYGLRGPRNSNQSLSLKREFTVRERWKLAIQADALNLFNWVRFSNPNLTVTSANFGQITAISNSPRVVQFNARFSF